MSSQPDDVLDETIDEILRDCVEMCADCVICLDTDQYLMTNLWQGAGPNGYYRNQIKALLAEQVRLTEIDGWQRLIQVLEIVSDGDNSTHGNCKKSAIHWKKQSEKQLAELQKPTKETL